MVSFTVEINFFKSKLHDRIAQNQFMHLTLNGALSQKSVETTPYFTTQNYPNLL